MKQVLYAKDNNGSIRVWSIEETETGLCIQHGIRGGSLQTKDEPIRAGKASRTRGEQIRSRYLSRINEQHKKGYVESESVARTTKRTNAMGFLRPMLAQPIARVRGINYGQAFYQHKYDGNRCLVTKKGGRYTAYSRNGKTIDSIDHIVSGIQLEEGQTIDGELYCHGVPLQRIASWIKRKQDATKNLTLRVYDTIENSPYIDRLSVLESLVLGDNAELVPTYRVESEEALDGFLEGSLNDGYEGGILRWGDAGYEDGKRSKGLAKIKVFEDNEFIILDVIPSKDGWARLELETNEGKSFIVCAPGSMDDKYLIAESPENFIGEMVNVKYANLTKDGIPFHPVATMIRNKEEE